MALTSRAIREAQRIILREGAAKPAIDVISIAKGYAHIVAEHLPDELSGMLIPLPKPLKDKSWAIVYNVDHPFVRQRFTVAHELGHLLLHGYTAPHADSNFRVRFRDVESSTGSIREEIEANQFAAELLMPRELVATQASKIGLDYASSDDDDPKLSRLARAFKVSKLALSIRLAGLAGESG